MQAFTDLVGASAVPAHAFDIAELTELTPALDTAQATHDVAEEASEASFSGRGHCRCSFASSWIFSSPILSAPPLCPHTPLMSLNSRT
jgi:hypothetical protein